MTIPPEIDFSKVDINEIETSGMLVDKDGKAITKVYESNLPDWVMLEGCEYDPTQGVSELYKQDEFVFTFKNVLNPRDEVDTSKFSINILNSEKKELTGIDTLFLPSTTF